MNASGCGVQVKDYGHALAGDAAYAEKAARISSLTRDLSELLPEIVSVLKPRMADVQPGSLAFHPPCTLQHGQQLRGGVEQGLRALGFDVAVALNEPHLCCGSAGTYSVLQPELSHQLRDRKLGHLADLQPTAIVSANVGCIQHLQSGTSTPVKHWVEALDEALWLPPCQPAQMLALWNNFRAAAEKNGWATPADPLYFVKAIGSLNAHGRPIPVPAAYDGRVLYEGELAVVIGRTAQAVSLADAPAHIFGYTLANDVTALELLHRDPASRSGRAPRVSTASARWARWIQTDFDPSTASLRTLVGGRERQNYALADMFFSPAELVHRISQDITLQPGDVILCGTSLGAMPMKPGTEVQVVVDGIGTLANTYG
jgi:2-keto-4-pentenoate hydratase/2-oxohepta-3-ene-1,7-dioic acid hydratase in catechol pathway